WWKILQQSLFTTLGALFFLVSEGNSRIVRVKVSMRKMGACSPPTHILTSSSPSKGEDFFRKTAMSRREDILGCIDVTIMDRSANTALPSSYSKTFPAFRAGAAVTHAAGLGGKRFVEFLEPHACVSAFIRQHGSELTPPRIEHRLGLSGLRQSGSVHAANEHSTVAVS